MALRNKTTPASKKKTPDIAPDDNPIKTGVIEFDIVGELLYE